MFSVGTGRPARLRWVRLARYNVGIGPRHGSKMPVQRTSGSTSLLDILDRVLDRGIRFEARDRTALLALSPRAGTVRIVVTSMDSTPEAVPADTPETRSMGA